MEVLLALLGDRIRVVTIEIYTMKQILQQNAFKDQMRPNIY